MGGRSVRARAWNFPRGNHCLHVLDNTLHLLVTFSFCFAHKVSNGRSTTGVKLVAPEPTPNTLNRPPGWINIPPVAPLNGRTWAYATPRHNCARRASVAH